MQPKSKRRVRTSVVMVGLTISMGAPNVLLTRPSDRTPAAEPVGSESIFSTVPASMEVSAAVSSSAVAPEEPQVQIQATKAQSQKEAQTDAVGTAQSVEIIPVNSQIKQPDLQTGAENLSGGNLSSQPASAKVVVKTLQDSETNGKLSGSDKINGNQLDQPATTAVTVVGVNGIPNRVKDSPAELRSEESNNHSVIEKAQTTQVNLAPMVAGATVVQQGDSLSPQVTTNGSAVQEQQKFPQTPLTATVVTRASNPQVQATNQANAKPTVNLATLGQKQLALLSPVTTSRDSANGDNQSQEKLSSTAVVVSNLPKTQAQSTNQANTTTVKVATLGQKQAALLSPVNTSKDSANGDNQKLQTPTTAGIVPDVQSAADEPTAAGASSPEYQVKAGDTLTAIARTYGISVSELVNANQLNNPNQLQINQQIRIPSFQYSKATVQTVAVIRDSSVTVVTAKITASSLTVPVVPPLSPAVNNGSAAVLGSSERRRPHLGVSAPGLPEGGELPQANAELVAYNQAESLQQGNLATLPAGTPAVDAAYTGVGGSISDEADQLGITTPNQARAKPQSPANPYFQDLQTDVQRLRQKYYAQTVNHRQLPTETNPPAQAPVEQAVIETEIAAPVQAQPPAKAKVATAPMDMEAPGAVQSIMGTGQQQVSPDLPPLAPGDNYLPTPFDTSAPFKGYIWPTKGVLTSGYGWRWGRMHRGIDIAAPMGTPVFAAAAGVVIRAGWNSGGYGNVVDVQHADGSFTRYAHNRRILVQPGQQVQQGQHISEMGSTGFSTGPHCHFEVHPQGKAAVNPIAFLPGVKKLSRF